ncbi:MAG: hypothetical protein M1834_007545 [Cirrosporium novae-zelandiae]|nr:MAG: hypothetical protein M1834_007545 [Cirrosporium novae-zelandiae]
MADIPTTKPQSFSGTQETLELLLTILPSTHKLTELLKVKTKKPDGGFGSLISSFQTATILLYKHLGKLKSAGATGNGAEVIHKAVEEKRGGDLSGHGTHIAGIILDLAPNVDIYNARVTKTRELDDIEQILNRTWKVDMITMSFGFQEEISQIRDEIKEVVYNGKIVFAAASNDGGNSPRTFPASQHGVICIHSTDSNGNKSQCNPSPTRLHENFSILGQHIKSCWPDARVAGASRRMTGTSFAVPVAIALAAFIIGYAQQEIPNLNTSDELKRFPPSKIREDINRKGEVEVVVSLLALGFQNKRNS